jgi:allophanate hydrolase subunit 2
VVIGPDLARLAQLRLHRTLRFVECDAAQAREERRRDNLYLQQIEAAMHWVRPVKQ